MLNQPIIMNKSAPARRPTSVGGSGKPEQFKLVLLGESAVGKSSMALRFVNGRFSEFQENTIGAAYLTKTVFIDDDAVKFEIWDTAGQERYHSLAPMYYRGPKQQLLYMISQVLTHFPVLKGRTVPGSRATAASNKPEYNYSIGGK